MKKIGQTFISGISEKPCVFLPFLGEFGIMIFRYIKFVHFFKCPKKIVMCAKEDRIFYPSADEFVDFGSMCKRSDIYNSLEKSRYQNASDKYNQIKDIVSGIYQEFDIPLFYDEQDKDDLYSECVFNFNIGNQKQIFDVAIGSRNKGLFEYKNYNHWDHISECLSNEGYRVCVVGNKNFSSGIMKAFPSWSLGDDSKNSCVFLKSSKIYLGTDCGISHLACFLQTPTILIDHPNREEYRWMGEGMMKQLCKTNKSFIKRIKAWDNPDLVVEEAVRFLKKGKC